MDALTVELTPIVAGDGRIGLRVHGRAMTADVFCTGPDGGPVPPDVVPSRLAQLAVASGPNVLAAWADQLSGPTSRVSVEVGDSDGTAEVEVALPRPCLRCDVGPLVAALLDAGFRRLVAGGW